MRFILTFFQIDIDFYYNENPAYLPSPLLPLFQKEQLWFLCSATQAHFCGGCWTLFWGGEVLDLFFVVLFSIYTTTGTDYPFHTT